MKLQLPILFGGLLSLLIIFNGQAFSQNSIQDNPPTPIPENAESLNQDENSTTPPKGIEVLTKGPVHEGYADAVDPNPKPTPIVTKAPPKLIEELPPNQKPEGDDVVWIPGYWSYDEDRKDYIWVSGFWRKPPPGRIWMPGNWRKVGDGWQWVPGFWGTAAQKTEQIDPQSELQYLPEPPESLDQGPSTPSPQSNAFYVPGNWVYQDRYVWQPGYWTAYQTGWIWIPAHYRWTPAGYIFIPGYWDYPLANRGPLFSPVAFSSTLLAQPNFVYTPSYVVYEPGLYGSLFVRRGFGGYYFGNYFGPSYVGLGYYPWCGGRLGVGVGFNVGFGFYDPLFAYYRTGYPLNPYWGRGISTLYAGRYSGIIARPPVNFAAQNLALNRIVNQNVINNNISRNINNTYINNNYTTNNRVVTNNITNNITNNTLVHPLTTVVKNNQFNLKTISPQIQNQTVQQARQIQNLGNQRVALENRLGNQMVNTRYLTPRSGSINVGKSPFANTIRNNPTGNQSLLNNSGSGRILNKGGISPKTGNSGQSPFSTIRTNQNLINGGVIHPNPQSGNHFIQPNYNNRFIQPNFQGGQHLQPKGYQPIQANPIHTGGGIVRPTRPGGGHRSGSIGSPFLNSPGSTNPIHFNQPSSGYSPIVNHQQPTRSLYPSGSQHLVTPTYHPSFQTMPRFSTGNYSPHSYTPHIGGFSGINHSGGVYHSGHSGGFHAGGGGMHFGGGGHGGGGHHR